MVYIITYDLNKLGQNYEGVENLIKYISDGECLKVLETVWLFKTWIQSAESVRNLVLTVIDKDDSLFVCQINGNYSSHLGCVESTDIMQFFTE